MNDPFHVLLTRFNVQLKPDASPIADEWLRDRLKLFARFTYPSVLAQRTQPDIWLLLCGETPHWLRDRISTLAEELPLMTPIYTEEVFTPATALSAVESVLPANTRTVITSRLDNDDAIAKDYISTVQALSQGNRLEFINCTHGVQWSKGRFYFRADPSNAFISRVEKTADGIGTVFIDQHQRLGAHGQVTQYRGRAMWLQVIHGANIANQVNGIRMHPKRATRYFELRGEDISSEDRLGIMLDQARTFCRMATRVATDDHRRKWLLRTLR